MQVQKQIPSQNKFIKIKLRLSPNHALEINYFSKPMGKDMTQKLFSYGTLQLKNVQKETFGRNLVGKKDRLLGYKLESLKIKDPSVLKISEAKTHPIIRFTGTTVDVVEGTVFEVTSGELLEADNYEVEDYKRIEVILKSGIKSWVYTAK